jgi:hypothetical protein
MARIAKSRVGKFMDDTLSCHSFLNMLVLETFDLSEPNSIVKQDWFKPVFQRCTAA